MLQYVLDMALSNWHGLLALISLSIQVLLATSLPACPDNSQSEFDFVVVGSGAGGGPVAARLAESGFSGMLVCVPPLVYRRVLIYFFPQFCSLMQVTMWSTSTQPSRSTLAAPLTVGLFLATYELSPLVSADPQLELNYTYDEYSPGAKFPRDDAWCVSQL
jgi:hypothetical protein